MNFVYANLNELTNHENGQRDSDDNVDCVSWPVWWNPWYSDEHWAKDLKFFEKSKKNKSINCCKKIEINENLPEVSATL